jgi:hypothetical protein
MNNKWLIVRLNNIPKIEFSKAEREFILGDYEPLTRFPGSTGHYDWLRSVSGEILGVRYWPFDDEIHKDSVKRLFEKCSLLKYTILDPNLQYVSILFQERGQEIVESLSNDQDLGDNGIYENNNGQMALCFELDQPILNKMSSRFNVT